MQVAYDLFSELNRHGKYNTVMRLYDKYELAYSSTKDPYTERMISQYDFARDNIGTLGINLNDAGDSTRVTSQNLNKILFNGFLDLVFQILTLVVFALVIMMLFRNFDSKSLLDNYKFEIKKAKDMH